MCREKRERNKILPCVLATLLILASTLFSERALLISEWLSSRKQTRFTLPSSLSPYLPQACCYFSGYTAPAAL
jgi:hypothetical protein